MHVHCQTLDRVVCHAPAGAGEVPPECRLILSSHDFQKTPSEAFLHQLADDMRAAGADIVKIACFANDITDCAKVRYMRC